MTERRVSVRLVGVGGDQLKTLMAEVGEAGEQAFRGIAAAAGPASATLDQIDRAAQAAGVEMKGLYERTALANAVMRSAAVGAASLEERLRAAGLAGRTFRTSADEADVYGRVLDSVRAKFNPLFGAQRQYQSNLEEIRQAHVAGALSVEEMTRAFEREKVALDQNVAAIMKRQAAVDAAAAAARGPSVMQRIDAVTGVSGGVARSEADIQAYGRALDDVRAKHNPLFAAIRRYKDVLGELRAAHRAGAISADELTAAIQRERRATLASIDVIKGRNTGLIGTAAGANLAAFRMQNLAFQVNDIGVSLAGGMNPFVVMAQQGTQIAQIYGFGGGGVNGLMRDLRSMAVGAGRAVINVARGFPLITAGVLLATATIGGMTEAINDTSDVAVTMGDVIAASFGLVRDAVWNVIEPAVSAVAGIFSAAWDAATGIVIQAVNLQINTYTAGYNVIRAIWGGLPGAIGDFAFQAANALVAGVESMLNAVVTRINRFVATLNSALARLPSWATGGESIQIGELGEISLGRLDNPFAGSGAQLGADIASGIADAYAQDPLGNVFNAIRDRAIERARSRQEADADPGGSGGGRGGARDVADEMVEAADIAADGWSKVADKLAEYATQAQDWGSAVGDALVNAFSSAEDAFAEWVTTGKFSFSELARSIIADMAKIAARTFITGPLSGWLGNLVGGLGGGGGGNWLSRLLPSFDGGGHTGFGSRSGGLDGQGGFLAMLHPRERVYDESRGQGRMAPVYVTINATDAESFRRSRTQVAADIQRAVGRGRRGM